MKILIFSPTPTGGLAEHAHYQARAMHSSANRSGLDNPKAAEVTLLCSADFLDGRTVEYKKEEVFSFRVFVFSRVAGRLGEMLDRSLMIIGEQWRLAWEVIWRKPEVVILSSYSEYLAPLWVWPHWILSRITGVVYVANLHDPVRDYVVGPKWWHNLSVSMAYWPISVGVVHQRLLEPSPVPRHVHVVEAPVGVYELQESPENPEVIRSAWRVGRRDSEKLNADLTTEDATERPSGRENRKLGKAEERATESWPQRGAAAGTMQVNEQPKVGLKGEGVGTSESKSTEGAQGIAQGTWAGPTISNPFKSEFARDSENAALAHSASCPASLPATSCSPLATPASPEAVFLAFGFIRDNKNLDLVIRALVENPAAVLVVMGRAQSKKDKPLEFYRNLAAELGVQDRVKFFDGFVPDEKLASYFAAADVVVLTYDGSFHSQSGVLNVAARARRPVLASAGESPLKDCVQKFQLGVFVEPDNLEALKEGMRVVASNEWRAASGKTDWEGYEEFASWDVNIAKILEGVEEVRQKKLKC